MFKINSKISRSDPVDRSHQNNFNFLRLMFAGLVLLSHAFELIDGNRSRELLTQVFGTVSFGEFAVDGFFLLSGYLVVKSWDLVPRTWPFSLKRMLRLYPAFIVAALVSVFVVGPLGAVPDVYLSQLEFHKLAASILQLQIPPVPPVFSGQPYALVNGSAWTIPFEFFCYLCVLGFGITGLLKRRIAWLFVTAVLAAAVCGQKLGLVISAPGSAFDLSQPVFHLCLFFFAGGSFYLFREFVRFDRRIAWLCAGLLVLLMFRPAFADIALAALGGYLLFYFAFCDVKLLRRFQTLPDVSYGLYLYGWPIQKLLHWYFPDISPWSLFVATLVTGVLAGFVSWYAVEKPFLKLKPKKKLQKENFPLPGLTP